MKYSIIIVMAATMIMSAYGQLSIDVEQFEDFSTKSDTIFLHNNEIIVGNVKEITDDAIKYVPDGEHLILTIGVQTVNHIIFASGRVQEISPIIIIDDYSTDWNKVVIVYEKDAVKGMVKIGSGSKKANSAWSTITKKEGLEAKVFGKLKKECAKQGGVVMLVIRKDSQSQGGFGSYGFAEIEVDYYKY